MGENIVFKPAPNFKFFDKTLRSLAKRFNGLSVEIGVWENKGGGVFKRYKEKRNKKGKRRAFVMESVTKTSEINNATKALYNCKGVPELNIPPRDYQTQAIEKYKRVWGKDIKKLLKKKNMTDVQILKVIGHKAVAHVKNTIKSGNFAKNKTSTIIAKGGKDTPLRDSGDLFHSIAHQVVNKRGDVVK
jgi:hypothetical protein